MTLAGALSRGRQHAESLMLDAGTASRPTGELVYDSEAQAEVPEMDPDFGFTSSCKIQARDVVVRTAEVGARTAASVRLELHLPVSTAPLQTGDVWTVTDPHGLSTVPAGTAYRVSGPVEGTAKTARRYEIERVVS